MTTETQIDDGGPAMPCHFVRHENSPVEHSMGMSLRDYLAAHAAPMPPSMIAAAQAAAVERKGGPDEWQPIYLYLQAKWSYRYADQMLRARKVAKPEEAK